MKKYIERILKTAVSVLLIILLSYKAGFKEIYESLRAVNPLYKRNAEV